MRATELLEIDQSIASLVGPIVSPDAHGDCRIPWD